MRVFDFEVLETFPNFELKIGDKIYSNGLIRIMNTEQDIINIKAQASQSRQDKLDDELDDELNHCLCCKGR